MTGYCKKEIRNKAVSFGTNPKAVTVSQENSKGVRASEKSAQDLGICLVLKPNLRYREESESQGRRLSRVTEMRGYSE